MGRRWSLTIGFGCAVFATALVAVAERSGAHYSAGQNCHCASCGHARGRCSICDGHASKRFIASSRQRYDRSWSRAGGRKYGGARIRREGLSQRQRSGGIR
jgi:hypothetical protein